MKDGFLRLTGTKSRDVEERDEEQTEGGRGRGSMYEMERQFNFLSVIRDG